jgi:hypothetical protein
VNTSSTSSPIPGQPGVPVVPADHEVGDVLPVGAPPVDLVVDGSPSRLAVAVDGVWRFLGGLLSVLMALLTGLLELYFAPLRVGGVLIGISVLLAVSCNVGLAWFATRTVGARWAVVLPWVPWTALMFIAAGVRTDEGDQLLSSDNWVGMVLILVGSVAFAGFAYRQILGPPPRR